MSIIRNEHITILKDSLRIAISGLSGCGNTTICRELGRILNIKCINYTFRSLVIEYNTSVEGIAAMAQKDFAIDRLVDTRQRELAKKNARCVVGSRLAIWFIDNADIRIYLKVVNATRFHRIQMREKKDIIQVIKETQKRDKQDAERYTHLYNIDITDYESQSDVVIENSVQDYTVTVNTILSLLKKRKYIIYE